MPFLRTTIIALFLLAGHAGAQTYPDHAIRLIVGFTPGSATDVSARIFAQDPIAVPEHMQGHEHGNTMRPAPRSPSAR